MVNWVRVGESGKKTVTENAGVNDKCRGKTTKWGGLSSMVKPVSFPVFSTKPISYCTCRSLESPVIHPLVC